MVVGIAISLVTGGLQWVCQNHPIYAVNRHTLKGNRVSYTGWRELDHGRAILSCQSNNISHVQSICTSMIFYTYRMLTRVDQINYAFTVLVIFAFGFIKLSIIFLYRRLFVTRRGTFFDWVTKISISVVISWTISFFFGFIFGCGTHFSAEWGSFRDYYTYCGVVIDLMNPLVVSDLVSDVMILCLPLPVVSVQVMHRKSYH